MSIKAKHRNILSIVSNNVDECGTATLKKTGN